MEKIDIHNSDKAYKQAREKLLSEDKTNAKIILKFLDDSAIGKTASKKARIKSVGVRARLKNLYLLKIISNYYKNKPIDKTTINDIEHFIKDLDSNKIKKKDNNKYSEQTKSNVKKTLILFLRWVYGETSKKFLDTTSWIDTRFKQKSIDYFEEKEVIEILNKCTTLKQKILVACLFDGGFRIEEFLNVRNLDVALVEGNAPYYRIKIRNEYSKTRGRDVPMFWSYSYDLIKSWIDSKEYKADELFYSSTYAGVIMLLKKIGLRVKKEIKPHKFRRASAFFYANKGYNEFQINKRYGWSAGSDVGGRFYIEQSKINIEEDKQKKEYENLKFDELNDVVRKQSEDNKILREKMELQDKKLDFILKINDEQIRQTLILGAKYRKNKKHNAEKFSKELVKKLIIPKPSTR